MKLCGYLIVVFALSIIVNNSSPPVHCVHLSVCEPFHQEPGEFLEGKSRMVLFTKIERGLGVGVLMMFLALCVFGEPG